MGKIYKIKSSLVLVMLVFLSLAVVACSSSPDAQEEAGTNIESGLRSQ